MDSDADIARFAQELLPGCTHRHQVIQERPLIIRLGLAHDDRTAEELLAHLRSVSFRAAWRSIWGVRHNGEIDPGSLALSADGVHVLLDRL